MIFYILLFSVLFAASDFILEDVNGDGYEINFLLNDDIQITKKGSFTSLESSKGYTDILGMPKLPLFSSMVMVDPSKKYEVDFIVNKSTVINNIKIIPTQKIQNGLEKTSIELIDNDFYNSSNTYPYVNVSISEPMIMRDIVVCNLNVIPFKYSPVNNELEVYESISINIREVDQTEDIRHRNLPKSKVFEKIYKNKILNYNQFYRENNYQNPAILYICSGDIESNSIFQQLVEWRRQRGYVVYTASLSEIGSSSTSIKNYIQNAYNNYDIPPEYVSLIGDVGGSYSIPTYYEDFGHDSYGNECEGDHPYSQLDGSDLLPEVLIGRMSIRTVSELSTAVYKILNYEKATYLGSLDNYYTKAAMFGDPSSSGNSCSITKEAVATLLSNHGFEDVYLKTSGGSWSSSMRDELTEGSLFFNYRGYLGMSGFENSDVDNANNGYKLPFATVLTCGTGSFSEDQTCMSEKFFRAGTVSNPKGGVAAIGTATWNTHTLFNNIVDMGLYQGLLADEVETAGACLASGKLALLNTYPTNPYQWISSFTHWNNLIGDPATHLWTKTPSLLTVDHESQVSFGTNYLNVTIQDSYGNPVSNALITLLERFGDTPVNLYTGENGEVLFDLESINSGFFSLTVTKNNFKPYTGSVNIANSNISVNIDSSQPLIVNDDNDGIPTAGERFGLSIPVTNYGIQTAQDITATLTSSSNLVTILNNQVSIGNINENQSLYSPDFDISISPTAIQSEDLELYVNFQDNQNNQWSSKVNLDIRGSHLIPNQEVLIQPGQTNDISISLTNQGFLSANNVQAQLIYLGDLLIINDNSGEWGNISPGQQEISVDNFNITATSDIVSGSQVIVSLLIEDSNGYSKIENVIFRLGTVDEDDPLGPDNYGYYIYDSNDLDYNLHPEYDWIEINPNSGGLGTNLNLSNSGNGNWSGNGPLSTVDLPFTFTFYGIEYNQITVCTNGWIAFDDVYSESFRNYPIPGAGGPSPMVAAFWDDLETGNNGKVYYYSNNNYAIVQWDNMRTHDANSSETFQIILNNDSNQPYGDNSIKIQYEDFNNTSAGDFNNYPPEHGSYSTIGIENHLSNDGLQYTYYNNYPSAAMALSDNTALFITTQLPVTLPVPQLYTSYNSLDFSIQPNNQDFIEVELTNVGEEESILTYEITQSYPDLDSPFSSLGGGPDSYGYFWTDSSIDSNIDFEWFDLLDDATLVAFSTNDNASEYFNIGFDFNFYGQLYTEFLINPNGWVGFAGDSQEWYNSNIPSQEGLSGLSNPMPAIFGFWDDLNPINSNCSAECAGNIYYHSNDDRLIIWFNNVAHWVTGSGDFSGTSYDFQVVIYPDGSIDINHNSITGEYSATVGIQNQSGNIGLQVDQYDGDYFENNISYKFKKPFTSDWLSLESNNNNLSGDLLDGEEILFQVQVNSENMPLGNYSANILIVTNTEDVNIPVNLEVSNTAGIPGDLNGDSTINITDIVLLINSILSNQSYNPSSDLNSDGSINVTDIVLLVNIVLSGI